MKDQDQEEQPHGAPPILEGAGELLADYDVLFCDVWGVIHDGHEAFPGAAEALVRFRGEGGTVVLVSNAPVPNGQVAQMLDERHLPRDAWDAIITSGDIALREIERRGYSRLFAIGPRDRDAALFEKIPVSANLADADAVLCSGLNDDRTETAESYRELLQQAQERELSFVCANPDLVVDVGGRLYLCAGALGDLYEDLGGDVFWAGKPHAVAYETALTQAHRARGAAVDRSRVLVVGDAVRTDLRGAERFGVDALFVAGGIHREDAVDSGRICRERLRKLFSGNAPRAVGAIAQLVW
jgi:HAD superfamily hydrolase (TIGR01459 family)